MSRYTITNGEVQTFPARLEVRARGGELLAVAEDDQSNVFHKVIPWRDGLLSIGGDKARLLHWTGAADALTPRVLYEQAFGGAHDRLRDLEIGDVDGDGQDELVLATHDQGMVVVLDEATPGTWVATELGRTADTFVHEIELGDLDGDSLLEIYSTPSEPNKSSGASQPGRVERWAWSGSAYERTLIHAFEGTHAKEILVADLGEGPVLLALQEGRTGAANLLMDPVAIVRLAPTPTGPWTSEPIGVLLGERQARFLVSGDIDGDGLVELVATGMTTGVWALDRASLAQPFIATQIDGTSGGFEQAAHLADLDGDGALELYVASEPDHGKPRQLRRYKWGKEQFERSVLSTFEGSGLIWGLSHAELVSQAPAADPVQGSK
ncbi:MAG: FG-GAP repeat domain-containing protein [Myxococcota bacterium]